MSKVLEEHGSASFKKVLQLSEFNDNRYLELAEYRFNKKESEWRKKKGVTLNKGSYKTIKEAIEREHENILSWLEVDYVPDSVSRYNEVQERALLDHPHGTGSVSSGLLGDVRPEVFES